MNSLLLFIGGTLFGIFLLISYGAWRGTRAAGWDNSNIFNWLRVFAHLMLHPDDFAKTYYLSPQQLKYLQNHRHPITKAFPYLPHDEFSEVVNSRPRSSAQANIPNREKELLTLHKRVMLNEQAQAVALELREELEAQIDDKKNADHSRLQEELQARLRQTMEHCADLHTDESLLHQEINMLETEKSA